MNDADDFLKCMQMHTLATAHSNLRSAQWQIILFVVVGMVMAYEHLWQFCIFVPVFVWVMINIIISSQQTIIRTEYRMRGIYEPPFEQLSDNPLIKEVP